jgi:YD repeat-containing protein
MVYTYDALGRETARATKAGSTNRVTHAATFNRAGHILAATETVTTGSAATTDYAYDALGRLTGYTPPAGSAATYAWDAVPNRTPFCQDRVRHPSTWE